MKFVDLFCGIGTIRMGMEQASHECVYSVEWDKHKRRIYGIIFGSEPEGQDIRGIQAADIPQSDCWCFGAPCQDFSTAGQRAGLEGDRSSLVREVFRLIRETKEEYRPKYLLYENVKGMLSSNKGFDYLQILIEMESLSYDTIEYSLLNSKDFGVPQNRERVFTIGHLRNRNTREVFPIGQSSKLYNQSYENQKGIHEDPRDIALTLTAKGQSNWTGSFVKQIGNVMPTKTRENPNQGRVYDINGIAPGLTKMEGGGRQPSVIINKNGEVKENNTEGQYASCLTGGGHSGGNHSDMDLIVQAVLTPNREEKRQNGRRMKESGEPMFTLTKQDIHGVAYQNRIRRLTPKECWRLQGIPDVITDKVIAEGISDTQMYRGAGDACTANVIYEIAKRL